LLPSLCIGRRAAAATLLGALAAGCSAAGTPSAGSAFNDNRILASGHGPLSSATGSNAHGWFSPDKHKKKSLIYWGNYNTSAITIYSSSGKQTGQITSGLFNPERLFVDKQGAVYATNIGYNGSNKNSITGYKPGQTTPFITITNGVSRPTGLTVDAGGTVYCANVGNDTITVYPKGQTSPSLTINVASSPEYLATDSKDNLYAQVGTGVEEFAPGSKTGKNLNLNVGSPGALEVDKSGNIIVLDDSSDTIDYIPAGQTNPSKKISATGFPFGLALSADNKTLYVSVETNSGPFVIADIPYPNGTSLSNKLTTNAGDWPVSVSPDNALGG
jgi:sugar lactone lactonase YvrE